MTSKQFAEKAETLATEAFGENWRYEGDDRPTAEVLVDTFGEDETAELLAGVEIGLGPTPETRKAYAWIARLLFSPTTAALFAE